MSSPSTHFRLISARSGRLLLETLSAVLVAAGVSIYFTVTSAPMTAALDETNRNEGLVDEVIEDRVGRVPPVFDLTAIESGELVYRTMDQHLQSRSIEAPQRVNELVTPAGGVIDLAGASHSRRLLMCGADNSLWLSEDVGENRELVQLAEGLAVERIADLVISRSGRWGAVAAGDRTLAIWDLDRRVCHGDISGLDSGALAVQFSADERRLLVIDCHGLKQFDFPSCQLLDELPMDRTDRREPVALTLSEDGRLAATAALDGEIQLWDLTTKKELWRHDDLTLCALSVAFSNNLATLYVGSQSGNLMELDALTGQLLRDLPAHRYGVRKVIPATVDTPLLTQGFDGTVKTWNLDDSLISETVF